MVEDDFRLADNGYAIVKEWDRATARRVSAEFAPGNRSSTSDPSNVHLYYTPITRETFQQTPANC